MGRRDRREPGWRRCSRAVALMVLLVLTAAACGDGGGGSGYGSGEQAAGGGEATAGGEAAGGGEATAGRETAGEDGASEAGGETAAGSASSEGSEGSEGSEAASGGGGGGGGGVPLRVGVIVPTSGVYAQLGADITDGMQLYLDESGADVELIIEDETGDPNTALEVTRRLISEDVDALAGFVSTASAYAARDLIDSSQIPLVVSNAGGNDLTRDRRSPWIFRASFSSEQLAAPFGTWVAENVDDRAVVVASDYAFGQESAAAFRETYEAAGGQVVEEIFTPLGSTDFSGYIARIQQADAGVVYGFLSGTDAIIFLNEYAGSGLAETKPLAVSGFMVEADVLGEVGDVANGAYNNLHWSPDLDNEANQAFVAAYEETYGRPATIFAVQGYDTARVLVDAAEAVGGDVSDPEAFREAIAAVEFESPRGPFRFDPESQNVIQNTYVRQVEEGPEGPTNVIVEDLGESVDGA